MNINFSSTVIIVKDISQSKTFYTSVLDQTIAHDFGKNITFDSGFAIWELRDSHIIAKKLKEKTEGDSNRFELYFETDDLEAVQAKLEQEHVSFLHGIHIEPWTQRTLRFFDPDKHLIEIGETLECFVLRSYAKHKNIEMVSEETFVPTETVKTIIGK